MGKFVNQNGKIRVIMFSRRVPYYVCRKGSGIFINYTIDGLIHQARNGFYSTMRENYETVNRAIKNNPILKLRDQQPDGLLIAQHPIQQKLPL